MTTQELLKKYLDHYKKQDHAQIPNVSLVPEGDSTLLFVNSGMFPLVPYLSGEKHPLGTRILNVQRCLRFGDIDEIGDSIHTIAFHMLGNWSLGDYFKKEQLNWIYEFFFEELKLDPQKVYSTVFAGDEDAPKDTESIEILKEIFSKYGIEAKEGERIFPYGKKQNWWERGEAVGELGGPDSEVFYYVGTDSPNGKNPEDNESEFVEIGNSVFMQYVRTEEGWKELPQKNVDFGGGLERQAMVAQNKKDIFETDNFWPIIEKLQEISGKEYYENEETKKYMRIVSDHMRACTFLAMDGVRPSNKDQGYVMRRILRRMIRAGRNLEVENNLSVSLVGVVCEMFSWMYPSLVELKEEIEEVFAKEEAKFNKTLKNGKKQLDKSLKKNKPSNSKEWAHLLFDLFQSLGYPTEISLMDVVDQGFGIDAKDVEKEIEKLFEKHQQGSRKGAEKKFKGGLADHSEVVVKYHTTTHLLQKALKTVLGESVSQIGSNITNERLRFDFPHSQKLTEEEIKKVEDYINNVIDQKLPVQFEIMPQEKAKQLGAVYMVHETYPDPVKVYFIGESVESSLSKEFCGGPHVQNTGDLSHVKVYKQDKIGEGKMRVYAKFV